MKKGIRTLCILAFSLVLFAGCHRATPEATPPHASPMASGTLSPPATPVPSAAATALPSGMPSVQPSSSETPAPAATGADGTIIADQTFSSYSSASGNYDVQFPDGWTTQANGSNVRFTHAWSGLQVEITQTNAPFTLDAIKAGPVADLMRTGRAVTVRSVAAVTAKSGQAVLVTYECNAEPQSGKQIRIENQRYYFYSNGSIAAMTLWAPVGANNWKIWAQMADTFEWRQAG